MIEQTGVPLVVPIIIGNDISVSTYLDNNHVQCNHISTYNVVIAVKPMLIITYVHMSLQVQTHEISTFMREELCMLLQYTARFKLDIRTFVQVQLLEKFVTELVSFSQGHDI